MVLNRWARLKSKEAATMFYICRYCVFTSLGRISQKNILNTLYIYGAVSIDLCTFISIIDCAVCIAKVGHYPDDIDALRKKLLFFVLKAEIKDVLGTRDTNCLQ